MLVPPPGTQTRSLTADRLVQLLLATRQRDTPPREHQWSALRVAHELIVSRHATHTYNDACQRRKWKTISSRSISIGARAGSAVETHPPARWPLIVRVLVPRFTTLWWLKRSLRCAWNRWRGETAATVSTRCAVSSAMLTPVSLARHESEVAC